MTPTREQALDLFKRYNETESLNKHALAVDTINTNDVLLIHA